MSNDNCKIDDKLTEIHEWTHRCLDSMTPEHLQEAHNLGSRIIEMLNAECINNGIKFIALFEALSMGSDVLESEIHLDSMMIN